MSRIKSLIHEIHRRSIWQVLAIYGATAWLVLQAVEVLVGAYGLPQWFPALAAALLLMGLPFVLATAFVQEGAPRMRAVDPTLLPDTSDPVLEPVEVGVGGETAGLKHVFNWRNAILIGVALFAIWGVVATVWLFIGFPGLVVKAEAAGFFCEKDQVMVAVFENETDQPALGLAVREAITTDLDQSEYINIVDRTELNDVLDRMRLADTTSVDERIALEISRREGFPAVVTGSVTRLGSGFQLTARIVEVSTGEVAVRVRETAADESKVVETVEQLSRLVRRHLGESLTSLQRSTALPQVTTGSLEALELFARGRSLGRAGQQESAIPFLEEAVKIDTAFATAYRALGIYYGNIGNSGKAQRNADLAYKYSDRLLARERYLVGALHHSWRYQVDSVVYYYERELERDPNSYVAINNLGDLYERIGRYEDAMPYYRRAAELRPDLPTVYVNIGSAARALGNHAADDSAVAVLQARFSGNLGTYWAIAGNVLYSDDFDAAEQTASGMSAQTSAATAQWGQWILSSIAALKGNPRQASAHADTVIEIGENSGAMLAPYLAAYNLQFAALAAGAPDRALPYVERIIDHASRETTPFNGYLALGVIANGYALAGDLGEARRLLASMDSVVESQNFSPLGLGQEIRAIIALQEGRPDQALEHLQRARSDDYGRRRHAGRLLLGDTYAALDRIEEAAAQYDTLTRSYRVNFTDTGMYATVKPLAHERAANAFLTIGDTAKAITHLSAFVELWQDADPELQPRVESAQRLLTLLAGER
jgi:tetratricopeptide (TPR) repeat protein